MTREEFEHLAQSVFDSLPEKFRSAVENVRIVIDDGEPWVVSKRRGYHSQGILLGLYEGIPINRRGSDYGVTPVIPDTITLFQRSIESVSRSDEEVKATLRDTLIHEIGHYFGMSEKQIRDAGY
jgi:predicted Zn-dependent protease with MMP-like domain